MQYQNYYCFRLSIAYYAPSQRRFTYVGLVQETPIVMAELTSIAANAIAEEAYYPSFREDSSAEDRLAYRYTNFKA